MTNTWHFSLSPQSSLKIVAVGGTFDLMSAGAGPKKVSTSQRGRSRNSPNQHSPSVSLTDKTAYLTYGIQDFKLCNGTGPISYPRNNSYRPMVPPNYRSHAMSQQDSGGFT